MISRTLRFAPLALIVASPLLAQKGDRAGEEMPDVPAHIVIPPAPILTAEQALKTFTVAKGFKIELVANDPLIQDPISMQIAPDGKIWVLEMRGYMPDVDAKGEDEPIGDIAVLEDTNGDGVMDKRTVFAKGLVMPRAMSLIGDGVLVAEPPHLWYFRDTNGDGVADDKKEIASDYGNTTNPEHNSNGLVWMMDNWIYSANHTTRFRFEGAGKFTRDKTITRGQWGITQDDTGRIYYNSNSDPLRIDAVASAYLTRNGNFSGATGTNVQTAPASLPTYPGRVTPGINRGYKTLDKDGKMYAVTAACGPVIYRGALFPKEFQGDAFIAEPSGNLIKRIKLTESGGLVKGTNAYENAEFLTSIDERFRPVNLFNGPDGALYVVDLYRGILQHKTYVTSFLRKQIESRNLGEGLHYGRIWRIVPEGAPKANFKLGFAAATTPQLIDTLSDANGWSRDLAQRLIIEKRDTSAAKPLAALAVDKSKPALARLHALWTLDGLGALERTTVVAALGDADERVVAAAMRLSEKFFKQADAEALIAKVAAPRSEPSLRLQQALTLGEARGNAVAEAALVKLVVESGEQPYIVDAVISGIARREADFVEALVKAAKEGTTPVKNAVIAATGAVLKANDPARLARVIALVENPNAPKWVHATVLDGIEKSLPRTSDGRALAANLTAEPKALVELSAKTGPEAERAKKLLASFRWPGKPGMIAAPVVKFTPAEQAQYDKGKVQFAAICAACHQPEGQGLVGLAPPLVNSRWVNDDDRVLARIVLNGKAQENMVMPTLKAALDDESISNILTYVRNSWGHAAGAVAVKTVAEARAATAKREEPWSDEDLAGLVQELGIGRRRGPGGGKGPGAGKQN